MKRSKSNYYDFQYEKFENGEVDRNRKVRLISTFKTFFLL